MGACTQTTTDRVLYINWFSLGEAKIYTYNVLAHYTILVWCGKKLDPCMYIGMQYA